jgi:hypothetical protein
MTQTVAMRDVQMASRSASKTQAYFNAYSGVELASSGIHAASFVPRLNSAMHVAPGTGTYQVEVSREQAAGFGDILKHIPPETPVYLVESRGTAPYGQGEDLEVNLSAVLTRQDNRLKVVLWSDRMPAAAATNANKKGK